MKNFRIRLNIPLPSLGYYLQIPIYGNEGVGAIIGKCDIDRDNISLIGSVDLKENVTGEMYLYHLMGEEHGTPHLQGLIFRDKLITDKPAKKINELLLK